MKRMFAIAAFTLITACGVTPLKVDPKLNYSAGFDASQVSRAYSSAVLLKTELPGVNTDKFGYVEGANCKAGNGDFSVEFAPNTTVNLPVYSYKPSPLKVTCTYGGKRVSTSKDAELVITNNVANVLSVSVADNLPVGTSGAREKVAQSGGDWSYKMVQMQLK